MKNLNGYSIGGKQLYVGYFQKKERLPEIQRKKDLQRQERIKKYEYVTLYIKNLNDTFDDERLKNEFSKYGTITSAKVNSFDSPIYPYYFHFKFRSWQRMVDQEVLGLYVLVHLMRQQKL